MSQRKIKDAKDLENNELIYFKGHAKATYISDGTNVEDALTKKQDEIKDLDTIRQNASRTIPTKISQIENDINLGSIPVVNHGTSDTIFELTPNVFHKWDTVSELTLTLAEADENIYNEYMFQFTSGDTATTFSVPNTVQWVIQPNILSNRTYQCSILNNIGVFITV